MEKFNSEKRHEVGINVINAIGGLGITPRYEYVLNKNSGLGADLNIGIWENDEDNASRLVETFSFTPYYRQYFFSKEDYGARGFYGEGFTKLYSFEIDRNVGSLTNSLPVKSFTEVAIGAAIGWKWVSRSGFLIDIGLGIGRNLETANDPDNLYDISKTTARGGVNFGWRF